jgi:hypothetical protein
LPFWISIDQGHANKSSSFAAGSLVEMRCNQYHDGDEGRRLRRCHSGGQEHESKVAQAPNDPISK